MNTEIELRQRAIGLYLQGWKKSEIAQKMQRSRSWVQRWIGRYRSNEPRVSLQDQSRAPQNMGWTYPDRIKQMVMRIREEREKGKRAKYKYTLVSAQAIYYELRELHVSPIPSPRTIHLWLKQARRIPERKVRKPPNLPGAALPSSERCAGAGFQGSVVPERPLAQVLPYGAARQSEQKNCSACSGKQEYGCDPGLFGGCLAENGLSEMPEDGQLPGFSRQ
jgi:transposase